MDIDKYLENTLSDLGVLFHEMAASIEAPVFEDVGGYRAWRYKTLSESLACFLKGVKVVSSLNACMVLLRSGHSQEIGAICRMIDDFCNEIFFLLKPQDGENFSKEQIQFLEDFFQEEFDKPKNPLGSTQKRVNVPIRKIHAVFGKIAKSEMNSSDAQELMRTTHQALSGYVHGAYPHIMEMFGGIKPNLNGQLGTPRVDEWRVQLIGYVYRAIMATSFIARKLGLDEMDKKVRDLLGKYEAATNCKSAKTAAELLSDMKRKTT
jgi:hypothetical protein